MLIYTSTRSKKPKSKKMTKPQKAEYAAWCAKYGIDPDGKVKKNKEPVRLAYSPVLVTKTYVRETQRVPSLDTGHTGAVTTGHKVTQYTGDNMVGIATMHKSNLVPVFNSDSAKDISSMRR